MPKKSAKVSNRAERPTTHGKLRVIAGHMRTRIIEFTTDARTRPMKDRTREAVFSLLGGMLDGYIAADLFAGSGILGFECLSRGAEHAVIIELLSKASREIRENAVKLGVADQTSVITADTFEWAANLTKNLDRMALDERQRTQAPWCVFVCPPYKLWESDGPRLTQLIDTWIQAVPVGSTLVVELDISTPVELLPTAIEWKTRKYHPAVIAMGDKS